jgi:hypothetical protein
LIVHSIQPAAMEIEIEHSFVQANASVWIDGQLVFSRDLHGESKRKLLLFRRVKGEVSEKISVLPGTHELKVRVQSPEQSFDQSRTVSQSFSAGAASRLEVKCGKHGIDVAVR